MAAGLPSDASMMDCGALRVAVGLLFNLRKSKMDQEGHGRQVAIAHGQYTLIDPLAALNASRAIRSETPGAVRLPDPSIRLIAPGPIVSIATAWRHPSAAAGRSDPFQHHPSATRVVPKITQFSFCFSFQRIQFRQQKLLLIGEVIVRFDLVHQAVNILR